MDKQAYIAHHAKQAKEGKWDERAAEELGRFQGKLYANQPDGLRNLINLSKVGFVKSFYLRYRSWKVLYDYIRSDDCEIPKHLCNMLIDRDNNAEKIFNRIEKLPIVLCHRDFWVANIPAYYRGFSEYADVSHHISDHCVHERILAMFGYRLVEWYKFAESPEDQSMHLNTLQKIYEMRNSNG